MSFQYKPFFSLVSVVLFRARVVTWIHFFHLLASIVRFLMICLIFNAKINPHCSAVF